MSQESSLINIYKTMTNFDNIINMSNNTILNGYISNTSTFTIGGNTILQGDTTLQSNLTIMGPIINQYNISYLSDLTVMNNANMQNSLTIGSNLNITNNTIIGNALIINDKLNVNNISVQNTLYINNTWTSTNIQPNNILVNGNNIHLGGSVINIGDVNSNVNLIGTTLYQASQELVVIDKLISLNLNYTNFSSLDIGNDVGILLYGSSGTGYIKTDATAQNYLIKVPSSTSTNYINTIDSNYNLIVTGTSVLINNISILSSLNVSNNTIFSNRTTVLSSLFISDKTNITNNVTIQGQLLSNNLNLQSNLTCNSNIAITNNINLNNLNIYANLFVSNTAIIQNLTTNSSLDVKNNAYMGRLTNLASLYISSNSLFNSNVTLNSSLINTGTTIINNAIFSSNLTVLASNTINGNSYISSNLFVSNNTNIRGNITFGSNLNLSSLTTLNIYGTIIAPLPQYATNTLATINGVPLWGFYRTGGIVKIRLENAPPTITLSGLSTIYLQIGTTYNDPGAISIDNFNVPILTYITSIVNNSTQLLSSQLLANQINDLSAIINTSQSGIYTIIYTATDNFGNSNTNQRTIIIANFNTSINAFTLYDGTFIFGNIINANYNLVSNNFTMECWLYLSTYTSNSCHLINLFNNTNRLVFLIDGTGRMGLYFSPSTTQIMISTTVVPLNIWTHIVWMQSNNNLYGFVNGILNGPISLDPMLFSNLNTINTINFGNVCVGSPNSNNALYGSLSQPVFFSIAKYSLTSFIPQIDLTPISNINILFALNNNNQDIVSLSNITVNNTISSGVKYKLNHAHAYDISSGSLGPLTGNFTSSFNNSNFTFELWIYLTSYNYAIILDTRDAQNLINTNKCLFTLNSSGYPQMEIYNGSWVQYKLQTTLPIPLNRWSHIVWMRFNNYFYNYINGIGYTGIIVNSLFNSLTNINNLTLGPCDSTSTYKLQGRIFQPRFTNTNRYTAITTFIPQFDLTPSLPDPSVIFFIANNNYDIISSQTLPLINNVISLQKYYLNNNLILPQYKNYNYVTAYNFNNGWLGKMIKDFTSIFYGNNDFTVDMWIYISYMNPQNEMILIDFRDPSTWSSNSGTSGWLGPETQTDAHTNKFNLGIVNGRLNLWFGNTGNLALSTQTVKTQSWNHIVYMCKANNYYGFINGYSDTVVSGTSQSFNLTNLYTIELGRAANLTMANAQYQFTGYMSQILIRSSAQYNTNNTFIPQTDLSSLANGNTVFYLNDKYTDISNNVIIPQRFTIPYTNRYLSYTQAYDVTDGTLGPYTKNFNTLNNANWTIEAWINAQSFGLSTYSCIIDFRNSTSPATSNTMCLGITLTGLLCINIYNIGLITIAQSSINLNEWIHVIWSQLNNNLYCFINGRSAGMLALPLGFNTLTNMNSIVIGGSADQIIPNTRNYQFNGYISQIKISLGPIYDPINFIPALDISLTNNDNLIFLFNTNNNPSLNINGNVVNVVRSTLNKWIYTYGGQSNIFYRYDNFSSFDVATAWTCEGWLYLNSLSSNVVNILSTTDLNNYNTTGKIEFGYKNNQLTILNPASGLLYSTTGLYSAAGLQVNKWNHFAFVCNNANIYFYINGNLCGSTPSFSTITTSIIQINGSPNNPNNGLNCINDRFSQITLMTFAKYTNEFIPEPDLTPNSFTNYITFLGPTGNDLVNGNVYISYNNNPLSLTNNLMPI